MATRSTSRRGANASAETDPAETNQPATAKGYHDAQAKPVKVSPEPEERPYGEAITPEHRDELAERGIKITKKTESAQAATTT